MLGNMTGAVGFAMHEDRLVRAATNRRMAEATQGAERSGRRVGGIGVRGVGARVLLAFAARLTATTDTRRAATAS